MADHLTRFPKFVGSNLALAGTRREKIPKTFIFFLTGQLLSLHRDLEPAPPNFGSDPDLASLPPRVSAHRYHQVKQGRLDEGKGFVSTIDLLALSWALSYKDSTI